LGGVGEGADGHAFEDEIEGCGEGPGGFEVVDFECDCGYERVG